MVKTVKKFKMRRFDLSHHQAMKLRENSNI